MTRGCRMRRVCFFFQAEDGIRDLTVTGVQTCALPICHERAAGFAERDEHLERLTFVILGDVHIHGTEGRFDPPGGTLEEVGARALRPRSEERRVGKECRSRWSPYH